MQIKSEVTKKQLVLYQNHFHDLIYTDVKKLIKEITDYIIFSSFS